MNLKEENEKLQALLCDIDKYLDKKGISRNSIIRKNIAKSLSYQDSNEVASLAQDEREAFEQHYHRFDLSRDPVSGAYLDSEVRCLWDAWQARATLSAHG